MIRVSCNLFCVRTPCCRLKSYGSCQLVKRVKNDSKSIDPFSKFQVFPYIYFLPSWWKWSIREYTHINPHIMLRNSHYISVWQTLTETFPPWTAVTYIKRVTRCLNTCLSVCIVYVHSRHKMFIPLLAENYIFIQIDCNGVIIYFVNAWIPGATPGQFFVVMKCYSLSIGFEFVFQKRIKNADSKRWIALIRRISTKNFEFYWLAVFI